MTFDSETLNVVFIVSQIVLTVGGAVFAIKRSLTDPLRKENEELRAFITSELNEFKALHKEELKAIRKRLELLEHKVEERVTREDHFRDVSGWREELKALDAKQEQRFLMLVNSLKDSAMVNAIREALKDVLKEIATYKGGQK